MARENKMRKWMYAIIPGIIAVVVIVFIVVLLLIKLLWAWVIPDLFPGAVSQGLIAVTISWYTAFKVALVIGLLSGAFKAGGHHCYCDCS